jgi:hypothetical protein
MTVGGPSRLPLEPFKMTSAQLSPAAARAFILGGNATVTLESTRTGARFTFKVMAAKDGGLSFVKVLTGADNENDFEYFGLIREDRFSHAREGKTRISPNAPSAVAFAWAWPHIVAGNVPAGLNVWHEGRCGRCNRKLTVPESIESGFGPECSGRMSKAA